MGNIGLALYSLFLVSLCFILFTTLVLIYYVPYRRMKLLEKRLKNAEILVLAFKSMNNGIFQRLDNDIAKDEKLFEELKEQCGGKTIGEFLKSVPYMVLSLQQDMLLEIERLSSFEPWYWWPEKYRIKLQEMKERAQSLLQEVKEHEKMLNK